MTPADIQGNFFKQIKQNLPAHLSLADEVAALLNISQDSAYRRIRGEKSLALDEIQLLATHYKISLDNFMNIQSESIVFRGK
jgi:plasmid maintenance system antidote protein VapI